MEFVSVNAPKSNSPFVIMPVGDIQWSGKKGSTSLDLLKRRIDVGMKLNAHFLGLGDYIDFLSPSNRQRLASAALYDTAEDVIDEKAMELTQEIFDLALRPTVGRWLGCVEGHHFTQLKDGTTTDMRLAEMLECPFLGTCAYGRINFLGMGEVTFWVHHGCGGGMKAAAPLNKLENIAPYWDADIFFVGHSTKLVTAPINRIYPSWKGNVPHLLHKKISLVGCGGFSKGYAERVKQGRVPRDGYVAKGMMNPATLGNPIVRIQPRMVNTEQHQGVKQKIWEPEITVEL